LDESGIEEDLNLKVDWDIGDKAEGGGGRGSRSR
jgi:hypothetical protein